MPKEEFEIIPELIQGPSQDFTHHLNLANNERIIFSAPYGFGKTTFIEQYFKAEENLEKYEVIHLFLVNYSIASNEDIFRYLKFDIICELLEKDISLVENDFSYLDTLPVFIQNNLPSIGLLLLLMIPKLGKEAKDIYEKADDLRKKFKEFHKTANKGDVEELTEFEKEIIEKEGSLYEENFYTHFIRDKLFELKNNSSKETILILDDLDRIDPHHIFRLFNVFAAHLDTKERHNKFGFDKVIFVCDIDNIRNIFKSNYGANTDFNGYIDKFYSKVIYNFDNRNAILNIGHRLITNMNYLCQNEIFTKILNNNVEKYRKEVFYCFQSFAHYKGINLRSMFKLNTQNINIRRREVFFPGSRVELNATIPVVILLETLFAITGDIEYLDNILSIAEASPFPDNEESYKERLSSTLVLLGRNEHQFQGDQEYRYIAKDGTNDKSYTIDYKIRQSSNSGSFVIIKISSINGTVSPILIRPNYFYMLRLCLAELRKIGYFS